MKIEPKFLEDGKLYSKSPNGFKIRKIGTNEIYDEAVDLTEKNFEYEETDILIEQQIEE